MINVLNSKEKLIDLLNEGKEIRFNYDKVDVKLVSYPKGSLIPRHKHDVETLHIVIEGQIFNDETGIRLNELSDYECGGAEYGPWLVENDFKMLIISPKHY